MTVHPLRLALLVRSAEASPFCRTLMTWFARQVEGRDDFKLDLLDLHAVTVRETLSFQQLPGATDTDEVNHPATAAAAATLLDQLAWWARALRDARTTTPYPA